MRQKNDLRQRLIDVESLRDYWTVMLTKVLPHALPEELKMSSNFAEHGKTFSKSLLAGSVLALLLASGVVAKDNFFEDSTAVSKSNLGAVTSDQLLELGTPTADSLRMSGEQYMRMGNVDKAIVALQKSVEMSPSDMDGRILYATALEKKLKSQADRDPQLYNFLVKQWLYVLKKADYLNQNEQGQAHLVALTGTSPRRYESRERFLSRVMIPEDPDARLALNKRKFTAAKTDSSL
jgi:hypothetical protein